MRGVLRHLTMAEPSTRLAHVFSFYFNKLDKKTPLFLDTGSTVPLISALYPFVLPVIVVIFFC